MTRLFLIIQTLIIICLSCCGGFNSPPELWEGISDNRLRVIISEYFPYNEIISSDNIQSSARARLDQRGSLLMASYIVMNLDKSKSSHEIDAQFNNLMDEAIKQGEIINIDCSENNYCRAIGEYNISEILKKLESINNK